MQKNTILWADDDCDDLMMMREILLRNCPDYQIVEVSNGKEAIEFLERSNKDSSFPCLVILDINMPIMDGKETLINIKTREEFKEIPVVIFTTSSSELDKMFCEKHNVEMITKPPQYKSLESAVIRLIQFCSS